MENIKNSKTHQAGFTYLEALISVSIITIVVVMIVTFQEVVLSQQQFTLTSYITIESANQNVQLLTTRIRNARASDNGAYALETTADQELTFFSDFDDDGTVERIRYFLDNTELKQGIIEPTSYPVEYRQEDETVSTIATDIRNGGTPIFLYYNADWPSDIVNNPLPDNPNRLLDTRAIEVQLTINTNPNDLRNDYQLNSISQLRMLKNNL